MGHLLFPLLIDIVASIAHEVDGSFTDRWASKTLGAPGLNCVIHLWGSRGWTVQQMQTPGGRRHGFLVQYSIYFHVGQYKATALGTF